MVLYVAAANAAYAQDSPVVPVPSPLSEVVGEYRASVVARQSRDMREEEAARERAVWLSRIREAFEASGDSAQIHSAALRALGVANSVLDFGISRECVAWLTRTEDNPLMRWRWQAELAGIARRQFLVTRDDQFLREAIEAYRLSLWPAPHFLIQLL
ncbi:hypothetical protein [Maioricimonas sp. JC845]|uniref:hypothetical protein n=1 Tax=Maioricimonas sp. JC845 TaxID=3232138 RepID=UPI003457D4C9